MDVNYEDLLEEYGNEYLSETDPDSQLLDMYMLNEVLPQNPEDAFSAGLYSYGWWNGEKYKRDFNTSDDYFTFDGYAHYVSVSSYDVLEYLKMHITEEYFLEWCNEQGYIEDDEDYFDED